MKWKHINRTFRCTYFGSNHWSPSQSLNCMWCSSFQLTLLYSRLHSLDTLQECFMCQLFQDVFSEMQQPALCIICYARGIIVRLLEKTRLLLKMSANSSNFIFYCSKKNQIARLVISTKRTYAQKIMILWNFCHLLVLIKTTMTTIKFWSLLCDLIAEKENGDFKCKYIDSAACLFSRLDMSLQDVWLLHARKSDEVNTKTSSVYNSE